ncbi:hypothetical protein [Streptomyces sp. IB201691-2A2]|uniref:hypothetical protein n=1 Tax=Streptomyces sp. IB201691-2A2 TaxID=2561920 RepID=UPI00163DB1EC|nr:hypothetical protein [Streptomyces sp. IB201691-2A2]
MRDKLLRRRRGACAALAAAIVGSALAFGTTTASASAAKWGCEGGSPVSLPNPKTARINNNAYGRVIELRHAPEIYSDPSIDEPNCTWGRISNARVGDLVWVDKSWDGGRTWSQLSITRVTSGTSAYTGAWTNAGTWMRACISVPNVSGAKCTPGWW